MKIGNCEMPDSGNKITIVVDSQNVQLYAETLAQSAFDNNIDLDSFKATLDNFSSKSKSSPLQILAWREEATQIFFKKLQNAGKLIFEAAEFLGSSDCDDEDDPSDNNK